MPKNATVITKPRPVPGLRTVHRAAPACGAKFTPADKQGALFGVTSSSLWGVNSRLLVDGSTASNPADPGTQNILQLKGPRMYVLYEHSLVAASINKPSHREIGEGPQQTNNTPQPPQTRRL